MSREIKWSLQASDDRVEILQYWIDRNKPNAYSLKLDHLFKQCVNVITAIPELGKPTNLPLVRTKVVRDYLICYKIKEKHIEILKIWNTRRNPSKLKL